MSPTSLRIVERSFLFSPVELLIRDALTGDAPLGSIDLTLERQLEDGNWINADRAPAVSSASVWSFPGLGRSVSFENSPTDFRVRVEAEYYSTAASPIQFKVHAYSDERPLDTSQYERIPRRIYLRPNCHYPFPPNNPIVCGRVVDSNNEPIKNAKIEHKLNLNSSVYTDVDGFFSVRIFGSPAGVWPPTEILLSTQAIEGENEVKLSSLVGVRPGDEFELEDDVGVILEADAKKDQNKIVVNDASQISKSMSLQFQDVSLSPRKRRFKIKWIDSESKTITLSAHLPQDVPKSTKVFLRSRRYQIQSVKTLTTSVTLVKNLAESWNRSARLVRFLSDLVIDVSKDGDISSLTVPVPDGFRMFEIELT